MITKLICINCPKGCELTVEQISDGQPVVTGNQCRRGKEYGVTEVTHPLRTLTTTIPTEDGRVAAVRTEKPIPKELVLPAMKLLRDMTLQKDVVFGSAVLENLLGTAVNVIVTRL